MSKTPYFKLHNILDHLIVFLFRSTDQSLGWVLSLSAGFLLGRFVNETSETDINLIDVIINIFWLPNRSVNIFSWIAIGLIIGAPLSKKLLAKLYAQRRYDVRLATLLNSYKDRTIQAYVGIGWDHSLSLQVCPELHRGWLPTQIRLNHSTKKFSLPREYQHGYNDFYSKNKSKRRFDSDVSKLMLTRSPAVFSDNSKLIIETNEVEYSQILYYREVISAIGSDRTKFLKKAVEGPIDFAHSLSLHLVIVCSDDKVLFTKRSAKVGYYPETWSCSAEEQLALSDIHQIDTQERIMHWCERLLYEELGLDNTTFNSDNLRILSIFLESDILNVAVCGIVTLNIASAELEQILRGIPRTDYEFTEWRFRNFSEILDELINPTRKYHPTSGYRMLLALIHRFGEPKVAENLLSRSSPRSTYI